MIQSDTPDTHMDQLIEEFEEVFEEAKRDGETWAEISLFELRPKLDEQALQITEFQEKCLTSRRNLAPKVKNFVQMLSDFDKNPTLKSTASEVVSLFKNEVDSLSRRSRQAESMYIELYQLLREAPDPYLTISKVLEGQRIFAEKAAAVVENSEGRIKKFGSVAEKLAEELEEAKKCDGQFSELKEENSNLSSKVNELEKLNRKIQDEFSERIFKMERQMEKENSAFQTHLSLAQEELENYQKREHLLKQNEERSNALINESDRLKNKLSQNEKIVEQLKLELEEAKDNVLMAQNSANEFEKEISEKEKLADGLKCQLSEANKRIEGVTLNCEKRVNSILKEKAELKKKIQILEGSDDVVSEEEKEGEKVGEMNLNVEENVEIWATNYGRKLRKEISNVRERLQKTENDLSMANGRVVILEKEVEAKKSDIARLEMDLTTAQQVVEAGRSMITSLQSGGKMRYKEDSKSINNPFTSIFKRNDRNSASNFGSKSKEGKSDFVDLEEGASDDAAEMFGGYGPTDRMLAAVQLQRSRFRKLAHSREAELAIQKSTVEKLLQQNQEVQRDNLALYRKLRRLQSKGGNQGEKVGESRAVQEEDLAEKKYAAIAENSKDPFRRLFVEMRHWVGPVEGALLALCKNLMGSRRRRAAFVVYFIGVHLLAMLKIFST